MGGKKSRSGKTRKSRADRFVRPLRAGASRARQLVEKLMKRLLRSKRGRLRATGVFRAVAKPGRIEAFQRSIDDLENRAAAFDLPVDFTHFRRRLEALLAVLLEVEDDRLVGEAAGRVQEELERQLARAEAVFVKPESLFGDLDLSRPEVARVRAAGESGDHDSARVALLERLAGKPVPEGLARWLSVRPCRVLDEAGLVGRGFLALDERGWTLFDRPVRWEEVDDPAPHTHAETATLARAYAETREESYAREAVAHLLEWAARVGPPDLAKKDAAPSVPWETPCASGRLLNWAVVFLALRSSKAFTPEAARAFLALVRESAGVVAARSVGSAASSGRSSRTAGRPDATLRSSPLRSTSDAAGAAGLLPADLALAGAALLVAGTLFDEFGDAPSWRDEGRGLLAGAARAGVLPDGGSTILTSDFGELSRAATSPRAGSSSFTFEAHERMLDCFVAAALAAPEDDNLSRTARSMLELASTVTFQGGRLPGGPHSDPAGAKDRLSRLALARGLLGMEEAPAGPAFRAFEDSGIFVMRAGASERPDSLVFRTAGPLGIHVAAGGDELLCAPGPVDRAGASEGEASDAAARPGGLRSVACRAGPPCDYVRATFGRACGAVETREVLYADRRFWVIAVRVRSEGEAERTFELDLFHPECRASPDGRRLVIGTGEGSALVALAAPTDSGFRLGETPTGRTARAAARGVDVHFIALVYPLHGEDADSLGIEPVVGRVEGRDDEGSGRAAGLVLAWPGGEYTVGFPHGEKGVFGERGPFGGLPPGVQTAVMMRSDGPWRTLFSDGFQQG